MVKGAGAGGARRLDEIHVAHAGGDALGDAGDLRHEHDGQRDDGVDDAGAERAGDRDRQQHRGKGVEHVDGAHDRGVELAADIAGDEAERGADHEGEDHGQNADEQRQPPAIDQPRQHVAAELVGAERIVRRADMAEPADHRALIGIGEARATARTARTGRSASRMKAQTMLTLSRRDAAADGGPIAARLGGGRGLQARRSVIALIGDLTLSSA